MKELPNDNTGSEIVDDVPNQLIDFMKFYYMTKPYDVCNKCSGFLIAILVHTALRNLDRRTAIRQTWGREKACVIVLFFMGKSNDPQLNKKILIESDTHHDIVQGNFKDVYKNLTYKHVMTLKWATSYCQNAKYVVKVDDDTMVNTDYLYDKLKNNYWREKDLIACKVWNESLVRRKWHSYKPKYGVSVEEYPESTYPPYCQGAFIIYSADVIHRLLKESSKQPYFRLEDVFVSGTLARRIGVNHTSLDPWYLNEHRAAYYKGIRGGPKYIKPFIYGPINIEVNDIYKIWKIIEDYKNNIIKKINAKLVEGLGSNSIQENREAVYYHFSKLKNVFKGR